VEDHWHRFFVDRRDERVGFAGEEGIGISLWLAVKFLRQHAMF
jgi:hypothetical protein